MTKFRYVGPTAQLWGKNLHNQSVHTPIQIEQTVIGEFLPNTGCKAGFATFVMDGVNYYNVSKDCFILESEA